MQTLNEKFVRIVQDKIKKEIPESDIRKWIRTELGKGKTRANEIFNKIKAGEDVVPKPLSVKVLDVEAKGKREFEENGNTAAANVVGVKNLEELVAYAGIDLEEWDVVKQKSSHWDGKVSFSAEFKRRVTERTIDSLFEQFEERASRIAPKSFKYSRPKEGGKLLLINCQDTHFGKPSKNKETGWGDYNPKLSKEIYKDAIKQLIESSPVSEVETVMLVIGSDMLHFENSRVETSSGTKIESDCSWYEMYNEVCDLISEVVENLASQFKVEVMVVTGNHARLSEYALGSYIKAFFRNHENVNVDNRPLARKYFGFKDNLIGFVHGDSIKATELPMIMFRENQGTISNYKALTYLRGHYHQDSCIDIKGVRIMTAPALCPPDGFHSSNGYVGSNQCGQALLFADWGLQQVIYGKSSDIRL